MSPQALRMGAHLDFQDGMWKHLGAKSRSVNSGGSTFGVKNGKVFCLVSGLMVREWDPVEEKAGSPVAIEPPRRMKHRVELQSCESTPVSFLGDGLYVCSERNCSVLISDGMTVMSGTYERTFTDGGE